MLVAITRLLTLGRHADPVPQWISARVGRRLLDGLLAADRHGQRVPFAIPDDLGGVDGITRSGFAPAPARSVGAAAAGPAARGHRP